jgi:hypothetical protein
MSLFGWDYPPGCSSTPYDEYGTVDLSEQVSRLVGEPCEAYWGEDDALFAMRSSERVSGEDQAPKLPISGAWNDELPELVNLEAVAIVVAQYLKGNP